MQKKVSGGSAYILDYVIHALKPASVHFSRPAAAPHPPGGHQPPTTMGANTISHSTPKHNEPNPRKKRSSQHPASTRPPKSPPVKWRNRQVRPKHKLNASEKKQAYELLKKFSGPKKFALPVDLPPWSPPAKLDDITSDLIIFRDYGCNLDESDRPEPREEPTRQPPEPKFTRNDRAKPTGPPPNQSSQQSTSSSHPPTTTAINTAVASSSSASPRPFSSPSDPTNKTDKARTGRPTQQRESAPNGKPPPDAQRDRSVEAAKDEAKIQAEIDWSGWELQSYNPNDLERVQLQYAHRGKEFKRLSDSQRLTIAQARGAVPGSRETLTPDSPSPPPATTGGPSDPDTSYRSVGLPKLKEFLKRMPLRRRNSTPRILSVDRPYRFCWPLDKTNLDSMADFVVFSRCALDEFLEINHAKIRFNLARFDDHDILFPSAKSRS
ncbi:hypothetical protein PtB15_5B585 [Puccinia triticina]|nr:hypothetical protein PtB15_5B585 [Puccinia triticina]